MKKTGIILFILLQYHSFAQLLPAPLQSLVNAENAFAVLAKATNTRNAFLSNMSDSTATCGGDGILYGKASWYERKENPSLLSWWPQFAGIAADGKLGFTTGPWYWSKNRDDTTKPQAFGYYSSVWRKGEDGKWKLGADIGISIAENTVKDNTNVYGLPVNTARQTKENSLADFDRSYTALLEEKSVTYLTDYFAADSRINRNGHRPYLPVEFSIVEDEGTKFHYERSGIIVAGSGDMGYAYGEVSFTTIKSGTPALESRCYLRIWKKENGKDWKIVLDVIGG